ncbi:reverse transcriptase domain-containing protein [Tanacetum coccineum]
MTSMSAAHNKTELLLNQLDMGVTGTIVVMICMMWDVNAATSRYHNTEFIVSNTKGNLMHCTARGNIAHNFLQLKEGAIFSVKNFTVLPNKDEFRVIRFDNFMLKFVGDTTVRKSFVKSDGFTRYPFQLVEIHALEPTNNKYLIDVAGYVTNVGRTTQTRTGSKTLDFYLANCRVTLWGGLVDLLIEKRTRHVGLYPVVITDVSVKLYNNRLYLSSTSSTLIVDYEKIPMLKRLKTDDSGVELTKDILSTDNTAPKDGILENLLMSARNWKYDSSTFFCEVNIDKLRTKKGWNYPSCGEEKCKKGNLDHKEGRFWCDSCNNSVEYPVIRYRIELEISNDTAEVVVVMFDETATSLLKCSASSILDSEEQEYFSAPYNLTKTFTDLRLQDEESHSGLPPALANIVGTGHTLELKSYTYYEHGTYESFTCWKVVISEDVEEDASSGMVAVNDASKAPALKRLNKTPSVATPSKSGEEKKQRREELEDSDAEGSFIADRLFWMTQIEKPKFGHLGSAIIGTDWISTLVGSYVVRKKKIGPKGTSSIPAKGDTGIKRKPIVDTPNRPFPQGLKFPTITLVLQPTNVEDAMQPCGMRKEITKGSGLQIQHSHYAANKAMQHTNCVEVVALITNGFGDGVPTRDIIVNKKDSGPKRISELHPSYMALQYPLLFPYGEDGYHDKIPYHSNTGTHKTNRGYLTMKEYYAYVIQYRKEHGTTLLRGGRLFVIYPI